MKPLTIINDTHLGAIRSGGTTPATALQLREYLQRQFEAALMRVDSDLLILGDLFDTGHVPLSDLWQAFKSLTRFLNDDSRGELRKVFLVQGNHDLEKNLTVMCSFALLGSMLQTMYPSRVRVITEPTMLEQYGCYVVPHLANQDLFDEALKKVPSCEYLLLHCNYDNGFAVESDHSLNLSPAQAVAAPVAHIVIAHEHQASERLEGKVHIPGNQFPSSVSDCLGNSTKKMAVLGDGVGYSLTWDAQHSFSEQDWRNLEDRGEFIRVVGKASAEQAADVVSTIAKFRNKAKALVITNAVDIEGVEDGEQIEISVEKLKTFNVFEALLEVLDPPEQEKVKALYRERA